MKKLIVLTVLLIILSTDSYAGCFKRKNKVVVAVPPQSSCGVQYMAPQFYVIPRSYIVVPQYRIKHKIKVKKMRGC